jgi:nitrite reductase/ring-hydroxylating ferredoxin subunit
MSEELAATDAGATTRRMLLLGVGGVGAAAVLAACGTETDPESTETTAPPAEGGGGTRLAAASEIPVGGGVIFAGQGVVVTQPTEGTFKGFSNICTHMQCPLANVDGGTINCTCHNSKFGIEDGAAKTGPATKPLPAKTVTRNGDDILLG